MSHLTAHFSLDELTVSETAARKGIDNTPSQEVVDNLQFLCSTLEEIRDLLGVPILITSGYRSPKLNAAIGGAKNSQHVEGLAADFIAPSYGSPWIVAKAIATSGIRFDQCIYEMGRWVHISVSETPRCQVLSCLSPGVYQSGLVEVA